MSTDLPHALAAVLLTVERDQRGYVLYRDPRSDGRIVLLVEGISDAAMIGAVLRQVGAEDTGSNTGHDFVLRAATDGASEREYVIEVKSGTGKAGIANLLWLAATDVGGAAARNSIERDA